MFDQPLDWYNTPTSVASYGTGPGTFSNTPSRSWHGNVLWTWDQSSRQKLIVGNEYHHEGASAYTFRITNYTNRDTRGAQTYAAQGKAYTEAVYLQDQIQATTRLMLIGGAGSTTGRPSAAEPTASGTVPQPSFQIVRRLR